MANKETKPIKSKTLKQSGARPDNALKDRKTVLTAKRLETVVAILLGITTLFSAWASWIGHLHGGNQSINFTQSNNMASQGTAEYNLGMQLYLSDYMAWNVAKDYYYELKLAEIDGDQIVREAERKRDPERRRKVDGRKQRGQSVQNARYSRKVF